MKRPYTFKVVESDGTVYATVTVEAYEMAQARAKAARLMDDAWVHDYDEEPPPSAYTLVPAARP